MPRTLKRRDRHEANVELLRSKWQQIKERSYRDLEALKDGDETVRNMSVRTSVALAIVKEDRKEALLREAPTAQALNVVVVVPRMRDHAKWEELAAAVDRGDVIDVEAVPVEESEEEPGDAD